MWLASVRRVQFAGLLLVLVLTAAGCISSESRTTYGPTGPAVGRSTLKQVKRGETTEQWVVATLGEPTKQTTTDDGKQILRYEYVKNTKSEFAMVPPFLSIEDEKQRHTSVVFEVKDGVVVNYWTEQ